jgi:hypothetical protein
MCCGPSYVLTGILMHVVVYGCFYPLTVQWTILRASCWLRRSIPNYGTHLWCAAICGRFTDMWCVVLVHVMLVMYIKFQNGAYYKKTELQFSVNVSTTVLMCVCFDRYNCRWSRMWHVSCPIWSPMYLLVRRLSHFYGKQFLSASFPVCFHMN